MRKIPVNRNIKVDIPADNGLPGLAPSLDAGAMGSILSDHFKKTGRELSDCRISYIRYKPRTNCIVVYQLKFEHEFPFGGKELPVHVKLYTADEYKTAAEKAGLHRWANFHEMGEYRLLPDLQAIIYFFPNDTLIDGLRIIENNKKIQRILYQYYTKYSPDNWRISDRKLKFEIMRYKPERRAVIRFDTRAVRHSDGLREKLSVFARIYSDESGRRVYDLQKKLYQLSLEDRRFEIAEPITYLPDRRIFMMEKMRGKALIDCMRDGDADALEKTAAALGALHDIKLENLPTLSNADLARKSAASFDMIAEIIPEASQKAEEIHEDILRNADNLPEVECGFIHGDFYHGQVIIDDNIAGIIDFDRSGMGDPASDTGNFIAHLKLLRFKGMIIGEETEDYFMQCYEQARGLKLDAHRIRFWTAFSLYQLAVNPFRGLEPEWRATTELILKECQSLLK